MILVTLGTQDKPFKRLIEKVEREIKLGNIKDEVVVQAGCTKYESNLMEIYDFLSKEEFEKYIKEAKFIITHAGVGNIIDGLKHNKKLIVVARKSEFGEHVNNHQEQILKTFGDEGYILPLYELEDLGETIKKLDEFEPKKYKSNNENFINKIEDEIIKLLM